MYPLHVHVHIHIYTIYMYMYIYMYNLHVHTCIQSLHHWTSSHLCEGVALQLVTVTGQCVDQRTSEGWRIVKQLTQLVRRNDYSWTKPQELLYTGCISKNLLVDETHVASSGCVNWICLTPLQWANQSIQQCIVHVQRLIQSRSTPVLGRNGTWTAV